MKIVKKDILFVLALILAFWFSFTSWVWTYYICLVVAYPAGVISLLLWNYLRKNEPETKIYKAIPIILGIGLLLSLGVLGYYTIFE